MDAETKYFILKLNIMEANALEQLKSAIDTMDMKVEMAKIIEYEKEHRGVDWLAFYDGNDNEVPKVKELLSQLNLTGDVNLLRTNPNALLAANEISGNANLHLANSQDGHMIDFVQNLSGSEIKKYIVYITQKMQLAEQQTSVTMIGIEIASTGVVAIGVAWLVGAIQAFRAGATISAACIAGVSGLGVTSAISAITIIIIIVLMPLFILMDKKAEMLAIILNRTGSNINMSYFFDHGKLVGGPQELIVTEGRYVSITKNMREKDLEVCSAGLMLVSKRDKALIGVEGACKLEFERGNPAFPNSVYLGFSIPLAIGSNCCYISKDKFSSLKNFYSTKYNKFAQESRSGNPNGVYIQARVDSSSGGEVAMIAVVKE